MTYSETITLAELHRHDLLADAATARSGRRARRARPRVGRRWIARRRDGD